MNNHLELPWSMKDTIENMKDLKQMLSERIKKANYDGKGETDAEEIKFDFDRAISALEKQIAEKPIHYEETSLEYEHDKCPNCKIVMTVSTSYLQHECCPDCGQKLDWSEVENE